MVFIVVSTPRAPTTVVMPCGTISLSTISGVCVAKPRLAAPAEQVLVRVDEAGRDHAPGPVHHGELQPGGLERAPVHGAHPGHRVAHQQHARAAPRLGGVDLGVLDQGQHEASGVDWDTKHWRQPPFHAL
jgi:hypothetical protein